MSRRPRPDLLAGYLRQGFGVEDAKVRFRLTYGLIAWMLMAYPDLHAHARIALAYKSRRRAA